MNEQAKLVTDAELADFLDNHPLWKKGDQGLEADLTFDNFQQAFDFMSQVAIVAEELNHHPNWSNSYKEVKISLYTHFLDNQISNYDLMLAEKISDIFASR